MLWTSHKTKIQVRFLLQWKVDVNLWKCLSTRVTDRSRNGSVNHSTWQHSERCRREYPAKQPNTSMSQQPRRRQDNFWRLLDGTLGHTWEDVYLEINENAKPTVMPPRRVPKSIKPKVKQELERLRVKEAVTPVQELTDWVSNMITTIKPDGSFRLCIDPHYIYQELKRNHNPLPLISMTFFQIWGKQSVFESRRTRRVFASKHRWGIQ